MTLTQVKAFSPSLPGGPSQVRVYTISNPAVGADWIETVPQFEIWQLITVRAQLTVNATVGNRLALLESTNGAATIVQTLPFAQQAASTQVVYSWYQGVTPGQLQEFQIAQMPVALLPGGSTLRLRTRNIQAGDQWDSGSIEVKAFTR